MKRVEEFLKEYGKVGFVFLSVVISFVSLYYIVEIISPRKLVVSFLDVGQGDAILIQTPSGKEMLIDGGGSDMVLTRLGEQLSYFNRSLDVVVATHPDADHITGLIPVLEKYTVEKIILSPIDGDTPVADDFKKHIEDETSDVYRGSVGDTIIFHDGVTAKVIYPSNNYKGKKNDTNDASVSMVITYGDHTFLLSGDLAMEREPALIKAGLEKDVTVYKAGHHGSKTSSGDQLLSYIRPEYVVISAGKDNRYGHPHIEALERLQKYSKEILSTIDSGTISFITDGRMIDITFTK